MLAVTTFSLSTMVSAYSAATSNVTPRATKLIMEDTTTQTVLSTFVGSFLFSLVGIIALSTGALRRPGRVVLFAVTILVIVAIVGDAAALDRPPVAARARDGDDPARRGGRGRAPCAPGARTPISAACPLPDATRTSQDRRDRSSRPTSATCSTSTRARCRPSPKRARAASTSSTSPATFVDPTEADRLRRRPRSRRPGTRDPRLLHDRRRPLL